MSRHPPGIHPCIGGPLDGLVSTRIQAECIRVGDGHYELSGRAIGHVPEADRVWVWVDEAKARRPLPPSAFRWDASS